MFHDGLPDSAGRDCLLRTFHLSRRGNADLTAGTVRCNDRNRPPTRRYWHLRIAIERNKIDNPNKIRYIRGFWVRREFCRNHAFGESAGMHYSKDMFLKKDHQSTCSQEFLRRSSALAVRRLSKRASNPTRLTSLAGHARPFQGNPEGGVDSRRFPHPGGISRTALKHMSRIATPVFVGTPSAAPLRETELEEIYEF